MTIATDNNVFDQSAPQGVVTTDNVVDTPDASTSTYNSELVGDGKKFKTVGDLEKGKTEADAFITTLQGENQRLREDLDKRTTVQEALDQLQTGQSTEDNTNPAMDAEELAKFVENQVTKLDSDRTANTNIGLVNDKMTELYGDEANATITSKAAELGVTVEFLKSTSASSPQAFYNLMGINIAANNVPSGTHTHSEVNTQALNNRPSTGKWEGFEKMRRENPRQYHSVQVQQEMLKAQRDGTL